MQYTVLHKNFILFNDNVKYIHIYKYIFIYIINIFKKYLFLIQIPMLLQIIYFYCIVYLQFYLIMIF